MTQPPAFSLIIGAYKEAENLVTLLPQLEQTCTKLLLPFEILVVDTNPSQDDTARVCADFPHVKYLQREGDNSYGAMVRTGIAAARGTRIIFMDADSSHNPCYLPSMLELAERYDIVIGSRYAPGGTTENSLLSRLQSKLCNYAYRLVLGLQLTDVSNSFRCYRAEQLKSLQLTGKNYEIIEEMLVRLQVAYPDLRVTELAIHFQKRQKGKSRRRTLPFIAGLVGMMFYLWHLQRSARKGR